MRTVTIVLGAALLVAVAVALGALRFTPPALFPPGQPPAAELSGPLFDDPAYLAAAQALRRRECSTAQAALAPLLSSVSSPGPLPTTDAGAPEAIASARIVSGLYAHACEDVELAAARLAVPAPDGFMDDWRLLLLAEASFALGDPRAAERALSTLLRDRPGSPLRHRGMLLAVEQAIEEKRPRRILRLVEGSRGDGSLAPEVIGRLETLAWEAAAELGDPAAQERAGRRLLVHAPLLAAELEAAELYRGPDGAIDWSAVLTPSELEDRAQALLRAGLPERALAALEHTAGGERGLGWRLLAAETFTRSHRAAEALALLEGLRGADARESARIAWERARAASDLSTPLGSGAALSPEDRGRMRRTAHEHLVQVVRTGGDRRLSRAALRRLFADRVDDRRFEPAMEALRLLRRLDPEDTTGARYLWNRGWEEYERRNHTGAVGYWSELASIYPDSPEARGGRYWSGRALEEIGQAERALAIYREIADVGATDFYRRHALARLERGAGSDRGTVATVPDAPESGGASSASAADPGRRRVQVTERLLAQDPVLVSGGSWPTDPRLERARLLSDLGLDHLALTEIEEVATRSGAASGTAVDRRAREALTGLVLARQGRRRASIPHLRRAFPALGGAHQASAPADALRLYYPVEGSEAVVAAARASGVPAHLVFGIIREESAFDTSALSRAGARGLMQLMPATGREVAGRLGMPFSVDRLDEPGYNVRLGSEYFRRVLEMFDGRTELALAGYNGGPYRMKRLWRRAGPRAELDYFTEALPVRESKGYVKRVVLFSNSYEELYGF